jgi:hypothetical protein
MFTGWGIFMCAVLDAYLNYKHIEKYFDKKEVDDIKTWDSLIS